MSRRARVHRRRRRRRRREEEYDISMLLLLLWRRYEDFPEFFLLFLLSERKQKSNQRRNRSRDCCSVSERNHVMIESRTDWILMLAPKRRQKMKIQENSSRRLHNHKKRVEMSYASSPMYLEHSESCKCHALLLLCVLLIRWKLQVSYSSSLLYS